MKQIKFSLSLTNESLKITAMFVFFLACFLLIWELIIAFQWKEKGQELTPLASAVMTEVTLHDDSPLFKTPLFGAYVPTDIAEAGIKQSMLDVQVVGIVFATKEDESQVIIRASGGKEKNYFIGDALPGGAIIKRITKNGVVVLYKGAFESIGLPKNELVFETPIIEE